MVACLIVCGITGLLVFLSVIFKPYFFIGKIKLGTYWVISLLGAIILLALGAVPFQYLFSELFSDSSMNPLKILVLFFSMTSLSVFLDEIGFFKFLASYALKKTGHNQTVLFVMLYLIVSALTIFTSNDIVVLTFTPFICFFSKNAKINPTPYLFAEFVAANTWSMLFIIGNPTNIYLASSAGVDFITYLSVMALPTALGGIASFALLYLLFRKDLKKRISVEVKEEAIEDKCSLWLGVAHLGICTILLAISSYLSFEMYLICLIFAVSLLVSALIIRSARKKSLKPLVGTIKRLPYELIPFVLSMFVIVLGLSYSGATDIMAKWLFSGEPILTVGVSSFVVSNIINNIPMSVLYSSILSVVGAGNEYLRGIYSAIIGSNVGAFFTQVGALAGIMWAAILRRNNVEFSLKKFIVYGSIISFPTLFASLAGLFIVL